MIIHDQPTGRKQKRVLVASHDKLLHTLYRALAVHVDGTFKSTPKGWYQTLIISAEIAPRTWSKYQKPYG